MTLKYDGSFEGFLCLVYEVYYKKLKPDKIIKKDLDTLLLDELCEIKTNEENSLKVLKAIKKTFPKKAYELIFNVFLCDTKEFELDLLSYIIIGFKNKNELFNINHSCVFNLRKYQKDLFHTVHKMTGFARFIELEDGTLYAKVETKYNIVYFLGKHFLKRFNNQNYIIHDMNRKIAFIKNENITSIEQISSFEEPRKSQKEEHFSKLWKSFFNAVTIEDRKNYNCQRNMMPLLYRTYMTEFLD